MISSASSEFIHWDEKKKDSCSVIKFVLIFHSLGRNIPRGMINKTDRSRAAFMMCGLFGLCLKEESGC